MDEQIKVHAHVLYSGMRTEGPSVLQKSSVCTSTTGEILSFA